MKSETYSKVSILLTRPIAFHPVLARICGSVNAGLMLSQAYYWTPRTKDTDGWFYKSKEEWEQETTLTRREQDSARQRLAEIGLMETKLRGVPATINYRINLDRLSELLDSSSAESAQLVSEGLQLGGNRPTSSAESAQLDSRKAPNKLAGNRPTITETTQETTTENEAENSDGAVAPKRQQKSLFTLKAAYVEQMITNKFVTVGSKKFYTKELGNLLTSTSGDHERLSSYLDEWLETASYKGSNPIKAFCQDAAAYMREPAPEVSAPIAAPELAEVLDKIALQTEGMCVFTHAQRMLVANMIRGYGKEMVLLGFNEFYKHADTDDKFVRKNLGRSFAETGDQYIRMIQHYREEREREKRMIAASVAEGRAAASKRLQEIEAAEAEEAKLIPDELD